MTPGLPHHRRHPRIDERRSDPGERRVISAAIALGYVAGLIVLIAFAAKVIG